jgi:hypothetical protein
MFKQLFKKFFLVAIALCFIIGPAHTSANPNDKTVEGDMTRFTTGNAYPKQIVLTGYNAKDDKLYVHLELEGATANYDYVVNVYNGSNGTLWGTVSEAGVANLAGGSYEVVNKEITASIANTDLELSYRIVATVTNFTNTP